MVVVRGTRPVSCSIITPKTIYQSIIIIMRYYNCFVMVSKQATRTFNVDIKVIFFYHWELVIIVPLEIGLLDTKSWSASLCHGL